MSRETVVFVCAHGAAKSVIASALFDRLATERGLMVRSTAAGTEPDPQVSPGAAQGLLAEGVDVRGFRPRSVTREELATASRVVAFGCDLTDLAPAGRRVEQWEDVPAVRDGFRTARDMIEARVRTLVGTFG